MKKGNFKIKVKTSRDGWKMEEKSGWLSENFGIHKLDDDHCDSWVVTHLLTGLRLCAWDYLREAKLYVSKLEAEENWPTPWNSSTHAKDYPENGMMALRIKNDLKRDIMYGVVF